TLQAHLTIGSLPFLHFGTEEQKHKWLAPLARGERLGAFGLTEPQAGSDAANIQTTAYLDGDSWVINGTKCFISNAGTPLNYGLGRKTFGKPLASHQAIQFKLADMATQAEMAKLMVYRAAWLRDQGRPFAKEAAMAKLAASEVADKAAEEAVQIHGGYGYTREFPVSRFYLDSKILTIGEGTSEVQ